MISLIFLSYNSEEHILRILKNLNYENEIIIVENSRNEKIKNLENYYKNLKVILPDKNLGFGRAVNLAIKHSKNDFVFINPADVEISNELFQSLLNICENFNDFALLTPSYDNTQIHSNYFIFNKKKNITLKTKERDFILDEVDIIDGTILLNKNKFNREIFDENFFIYFETWDLSKRVQKQNMKMYVIKDLKFKHFGQQSHNSSYDHAADIFRAYHYTWSKFYYFKKHNGYFTALRKIFPNFKRSLFNYYLKFNLNKKLKIENKFRLIAIIESIFLKKNNPEYQNYEFFINLLKND